MDLILDPFIPSHFLVVAILRYGAIEVCGAANEVEALQDASSSTRRVASLKNTAHSIVDPSTRLVDHDT